MKQDELMVVAQKLLAKGNKVSKQQMQKYGFCFEKGFEAFEIQGRCASDEYDNLPKIETLGRVTIGDPICFDAYYMGEVDLIVHHTDFDYDGYKLILTVQIWEQNGKHALTNRESKHVDAVDNFCNINFAETQIEPYIKQVE